MFGIDFFNNLVRFVFLRFDDRIETLYRMSERLRRMNEEVIYIPSSLQAKGYAELSEYTRRFKLWQAVHNRLPY